MTILKTTRTTTFDPRSVIRCTYCGNKEVKCEKTYSPKTLWHKIRHYLLGTRFVYYQAICRSCFARTKYKKTKKEALYDWNWQRYE